MSYMDGHISAIPAAPLNLVPEPGSISQDKESTLLSELQKKKAQAKKAIAQRKKADAKMLSDLEKKESMTAKEQLRELQKSELDKPVIDHQHNGLWDTMADNRNDAAVDGLLSQGEAERRRAQKEMDRRIQAEREASEQEDAAFKLKLQKRAELAEREKREKVRLKQAADQAQKKEDARRIKEEMQLKNKEVREREEMVAKDKRMDALRERKVVLEKKERDEAYSKKMLADWTKDMHDKREKDNIREQAEKREQEADERDRRKRQLQEWYERETARLKAEAAALAKMRMDKKEAHAHAREKAIQEELLRLQRQLDAEMMATSAASYAAEKARKAAEAAMAAAQIADKAVEELKQQKTSFIKLW